jgi:hypothetical protein
MSADLGYFPGPANPADAGFAGMLRDAVITLFESETGGHGFFPARALPIHRAPPGRAQQARAVELTAEPV